MGDPTPPPDPFPPLPSSTSASPVVAPAKSLLPGDGSQSEALLGAPTSAPSPDQPRSPSASVLASAASPTQRVSDSSSWRDKVAVQHHRQYWTLEGLSHLASGIGKPICLDSQTAAMDRIGYAKICIKVANNVVLPDKVTIRRLDAASELICASIPLSYPWKPQAANKKWIPTGRKFSTGWSDDLAGGSIQSTEQHTQPSTGPVRDCELEDGLATASEGAPAGDTSKDSPSEDYTGQLTIDAVDHVEGVAQNSTVVTHQAEQGELAHEITSAGGDDHADGVARTWRPHTPGGKGSLLEEISLGGKLLDHLR
ncbi:hypothetical protein K2173_004109 [Erythroxylum novogranatense]|uniref:Uncharacterized protein n=1 Tax=Erythroxylum novogranatense TaxID=1862640 RepID=A0AAV8SXR1_9ROSI|nr:hypothetical protein K2173_004109 [Erythroxylum novogranatense]